MVKLTDAQKAELEALEKLSDDEIDLSDIPEQPIDWSKSQGRDVLRSPTGRTSPSGWTGTSWTGSRNRPKLHEEAHQEDQPRPSWSTSGRVTVPRQKSAPRTLRRTI